MKTRQTGKQSEKKSCWLIKLPYLTTKYDTKVLQKKKKKTMSMSQQCIQEAGIVKNKNKQSTMWPKKNKNLQL